MHTTMPAQPVAHRIAWSLCIALNLTLASCGGGSTGDAGPTVTPPVPPATDPTPPATDPPPQPAPDFLAVGWTQQDARSSEGLTLSVFDPAAPNPPKLTVTGTGWPFTEQATSFDAATGSVSYLGEPAVYYTQDHKLYKVSLRKSDATVPVQVSSMTNVCWIGKLWQSSLGLEPLIEVGVAASPSECQIGYLPTHAVTRAGASASEPAMSTLSHRTILQQLADPSSPQAQYFVVRTDPGADLWLYDQTMRPIGPIAGGAAAFSFSSSGSGFRTSSALYLGINDEIREISWSAAGADLKPAIFKFTGHGSMLPLDDHSYLLIDGLALRRVSGGTASTILASFDSSKGDLVDVQTVTPTHVIVQQSSSSNSQQAISLYSVAKQDLHVQALGVNVGANAVIGQADGAVFYLSNGSVRRINDDGTGDRYVGGGPVFASLPLRSRSYSIDASPTLDGVVWCERASGETNCANGQLKMLNTHTLATTVLGQFSHPNVYQWFGPIFSPEDTLSPYLTLDTPLVLVPNGIQLTPTSPGTEELYVARPGTAGSLVQVNQ